MPLTHLQKRRFNQENKIQELISTFKGLQNPYAIAGPAVNTLLPDANPCDVIDVAQKVIDGGGSVNDARKVLTLEKNFNPFTVQSASICLDPSKPENPQLRGILPLLDPALPLANETNIKTQERNDKIFSGELDGVALAKGKSIADQLVELGFIKIQGVNPPEKQNPPTPTPAPTNSPFGTCDPPTIEYNSTTFHPLHQSSFPHPTSPTIDPILLFICDRLKTSCNIPESIKSTRIEDCVTAVKVVSMVNGGGAKADAVNSVFGVKTRFSVDSGDGGAAGEMARVVA
ncbi:hypothetical protein BKA69DRAFT_1148153 [Paraphysoderma sedebokerense]|nr:hypothetical protein BKA69DRAFT_1148153 [Paraphysoderma sedebokerense]